MKVPKDRPEELDMEEFYRRENQFKTYPMGMKVPDKPEIIFPKSTYDPMPGATIKGLQDSGPVGTIRVDTTPIDAEFFIIDEQGNEISFGRTTPSITITDVDVGTYNYIIRKEGYADYTGNIEVIEGQICCVNINLPEGTKKQQCNIQPPGYVPPSGYGFPPSQPGYIVLPERTVTIIGIILALAAGLLIGYAIFRKRD